MEQVMNQPFWMLVPWAVFAVAAGIKFWRLTTVFRSHRRDSRSGTEQFRQSLERIWAQDQRAG